MIKAIFYKEWIKMRCFYPLSALFLFGATAYALLRVQRVIPSRVRRTSGR